MITRPKGNFAILWLVVAIVLLIVGVWLGSKLNSLTSDTSKYSAVYLTTGDIYFGELSMFPKVKLKNSWHLDRGVDENNQPQVGLTEMNKVFWGPSGTLYLNRDSIVYSSPLRSDSEVIKALTGQVSQQQPTNDNSGTRPADSEDTGSDPAE